MLTDNPPRARSRGLRTPYAEAVKDGTRERHQGRATLDLLYVNGDVENTSGSAGESAGLIHEIKSVRADHRRHDRGLLARDRPAGGAAAAGAAERGGVTQRVGDSARSRTPRR